jgi:hypothetical protein
VKANEFCIEYSLERKHADCRSFNSTHLSVFGIADACSGSRDTGGF